MTALARDTVYVVWYRHPGMNDWWYYKTYITWGGLASGRTHLVEDGYEVTTTEAHP